MTSGEPRFLWREYQKALGELTLNCREQCHGCGIQQSFPEKQTPVWKVPVLMHTGRAEIRVTFGVSGALIYTSVLDMGLWGAVVATCRIHWPIPQGFLARTRASNSASALAVCWQQRVRWSTPARRNDGREAFREAIERHAPPARTVSQVEEVPLRPLRPNRACASAHYRCASGLSPRAPRSRRPWRTFWSRST